MSLFTTGQKTQMGQKTWGVNGLEMIKTDGGSLLLLTLFRILKN